MKEDLKQLVEEYINFKKTDDSFMLGKRVQGIRGVIKNEALISFILWKMKGKKLSELVELSEALKNVANFIGSDMPIGGPFKNEEEFEEAFKRVDSVIERRVQQKLLEQSKQSAESTSNSGDCAGNRTVKSCMSTFFKRFFS